MPTPEPYTDEDGMLIADRTVSFRRAAGAEIPPVAEENKDRLLTDAVVDGNLLVADGAVSFRTTPYRYLNVSKEQLAALRKGEGEEVQEHPGHANQKVHSAKKKGGGGGEGPPERPSTPAARTAAFHQMVKDENKAGGRLRVRDVRTPNGIEQSLTGRDRIGRSVDVRGKASEFLHDYMADPDRLPKPDYGPAWKGLQGLDLRKNR